MTKGIAMKTMLMASVLSVAACAVEDAEVQVDAVEQAASSTTTRRWNGKGAHVQHGDPMTQTGIMLFANEDATTHTASVYLDMQGPDLSSWSCPWGDMWNCQYTRFTVTRATATIPRSELVIRQAQGAEATLTTTLTAERCIYEYYWPVSCAPVSIAIDLTWTGNGLFSSTTNGTTTRTEGNVTYKEKGSYASVSTNLQGTVGDVVISNGFGMIQDSKGSTVTREIVTTMP